MRDKQDFRDNLERLDSAFPGKELLNISEVTKYLGIGRGKVARMFPFDTKTRLCSKVTVARIISN